MCADYTNSVLLSPAQDSFHKILRQLAGQLWQSKLQETLQDSKVTKYLTEQECSCISTYEQLFDVFIAKELVNPSNLTLLKTALRNHDSGCALMRAVYEAGFGKEGLASETEESLSRRHSSSLRKLVRQTRALKDFKLLLRRIDAQLDSSEDLSALKLLCCSVLSFRQLDGITNTLELCNALRRTRCISAQKPEFLYRLLHDCGRWDLCDLVDGYVYTCEENHTNSTSTWPQERKISLNPKINYQFARGLKIVGDQLGSDDLATMKLLAGTCIPDSKLEKAVNVYEFFILLQERGKLCHLDISFLEQLLDDKPHVIGHLYELGFGCKTQPQRCCSTSSNESLLNFKRLLRTIGSRLTKENIQQIKFLCPDDVGPNFSSSGSGIELLSLLEKRGEIGPNNLRFLIETLEEVGRRDLSTTVRTHVSIQGTKQLPITDIGLHTAKTNTQTISSSVLAPVCRENVANFSDNFQLLAADDKPQADHSRHAESSTAIVDSLKQALEELSVLRERLKVHDQFRTIIEIEIKKRDSEIKELTKTVNAQQMLLNRLVGEHDLKPR